jgi:hypothetical protein
MRGRPGGSTASRRPLHFITGEVMETLIIAAFVAVFIITLVDSILKSFWVEKYLTSGVPMYRREAKSIELSLIGLFTQLNNDIPETKRLLIRFNLSKDNNKILFRERYFKLVQMGNYCHSFLHGTIEKKNDSFLITGYLGIPKIILALPSIIFIAYALVYFLMHRSINIYVLLFIVVFIIINAAIYYSDYKITSNYLDKI